MGSISLASVMGYTLGILILIVSAKLFSAPFKAMIRLILNSLLGGIVMLLINHLPFLNITLGINPISLAVVGILGIPGLCLLLAAQILF